MDDLALLRAFEPVLRFDQGEHFLPTGVEDYVRRCTLWSVEAGGASRLLADVGELDLERLAAAGRLHGDRELSLRFVQQEFRRRPARAWRRDWVRGGGGARFGAVGLVGRFSDIILRGSLLLRGRVPGGHIAAAHTDYRQHLHPERTPYYGRVLRDGGWTICQYWYFYAANDWRTSFNGVNDHEADWEMVSVYLVEGVTEARPAWVALSAHEYHGPRVRRRWDDPDLRLEGDHPVVFVGAGSHSGAFVPGEYLVTVDAPDLRGAVRLLTRVRALITPWTPKRDAIAIPFIDYARGDGLTVGPGGEREWEPVVIGDQVPWVRDYAGLWGLETHDRLGGERAPSGPRFNREGTLRLSWTDALGWAGMVGVPTGPAEASMLLTDRLHQIDQELAEAQREIDAQRETVRQLGVAVDSLYAGTTSHELLASRGAMLSAAEDQLEEVVGRRTRLLEERTVHERVLADPPPPPDPQRHLRGHVLQPYHQDGGRARVLRVWGLVSVPLLLLGIVMLIWQRTFGLWPAIGLVIFVVLAVEAFARGRLLRFLAGVVVLVAGVLAAFWMLEYWRVTLTVLLATAAALILFLNSREAVRRRTRRPDA